MFEPLEGRRLLSIGTLRVDADSTAAVPDGLTWETAYPALQDALDRASVLNTDDDGDNDITAVWIAEGTYKPTTRTSAGDARSATFSMLDNVSLYGRFAGDEPDLDTRHGVETILSGDLDATGDLSDGDAYHVVYASNIAGVTLDALAITGGKGTGSGGGVYSKNATLTIIGSTISGNSANYNGGGIYSQNGTLTVTGSTISGNSARDGGGIYNSGTLTIMGSTISGNSAGSGGGISSWYGTLTVSGSTISGNSASSGGGGISSRYGTLAVTRSTISGNSASSGGGGISSANTATITGSTISGNSAGSSGGIYND